jgi:hypothetical protein
MKWDVNPLRLNFNALTRHLFSGLMKRLPNRDVSKKGPPTLYQKLSVVNELTIPGYLENVPLGSIGQIDFYKRNTCDWYQNFVDMAVSAQKKFYLPIYRMADGEFIFNVGRRTPLISHENKYYGFIIYLFNLTRIKLNSAFAKTETTCWGENYDGKSLPVLKKNYIKINYFGNMDLTGSIPDYKPLISKRKKLVIK